MSSDLKLFHNSLTVALIKMVTVRAVNCVRMNMCADAASTYVRIAFQCDLVCGC